MNLSFILKCLVGGFTFGVGLMAAMWLLYGIVMTSTMERFVADIEDFEGIDGFESIEVLEGTGAPIASTAPPVRARTGFLGSTARFSEGFSDNRQVLASGPGEIRGTVSADGAPVAGVKLRLALNGGIRSQWGVTAEDGEYAIRVPYGTYETGGFELDKRAADDALPGLILHPHTRHDSAPFTVAADSPGPGIDLAFVRPVVKLNRETRFTPGATPMIIAWEPFPEAASYSVRLWEKSSPSTYDSQTVFHHSERPTSQAASLDLAPFADRLKAGHYYLFQVEALSGDGQVLSETPWDHRARYDFTIDDTAD